MVIKKLFWVLFKISNTRKYENVIVHLNSDSKVFKDKIHFGYSQYHYSVVEKASLEACLFNQTKVVIDKHLLGLDEKIFY